MSVQPCKKDTGILSYIPGFRDGKCVEVKGQPYHHGKEVRTCSSFLTPASCATGGLHPVVVPMWRTL